MFNGVLGFGDQQDRKKRLDSPIQVTQPSTPRGAFNQGTVAPPIVVNSAQAATRPVSASPSLRDVARMFLGGTSKTINTGLGGVALAGNRLSEGLNQVLNNGPQRQKVTDFNERQAQDINNTFLKPGSGLLGEGGFMDRNQFATASPGEALLKGAGAGAQTAAEIAPVGRGVVATKGAAPLLRKVASGAVEGASAGALGEFGNQLTQGQGINPLEVAKSAGLGGVVGGGIPLAAGGAKKVIDATGDIQARQIAAGMSPRMASQGGFIGAAGDNPDALPKEMRPLAKVAQQYKTAEGFQAGMDSRLYDAAVTAGNGNKAPLSELLNQLHQAGNLQPFHTQVQNSVIPKSIYVKGSQTPSAASPISVSTPETRRIPIKVTQPQGNRVTEYAVANTLDTNNKPTFELVPLDNSKHTLSNGMVVDKAGKPVGSYLGVDEHGNQYAYIEGKPVNINGVLGNIDQWGNMNKSSWDMERLIEANAPNLDTARKVQKFTTAFKDQQEAAMKTDLKQRRTELSGVENDLTSSLPRGIKRNELSQDMFRAMEGKADFNQLRERYGADYVDNKMVPALDWARNRFDEMLNNTNNVLKRNGYDPIPRRENYITHIQEDPSFWQKVGIGIQDLNPMGSSISSDINPGKTRASIPDEIVGNTANTGARRRWNPFAQQRQGDQAKQDFFDAIDKYYEPMLFNQYMTPAASRARVVERAFRTNDKAKQLRIDELAQIVGMSEAKDKVLGVGKTNPNYKAGRVSPLVTAWQEYGNMLAGKTNAWDRTVIDRGGEGGKKLLDLSVKAQGIAGANSIPGSATSAVAQVLSLPQTIARDSPKSVLLAAKDMLGFGPKDKADPMRQSSFMRARYTDAESQRLSTMRQYTKNASIPMNAIERETGELSWRSAYHQALAQGKTGKDAIIEADIQTKKTLAGRGIGDRPIAMNSKAAGIITQFGLEVNNMRLQFFNDFTPAQKLKFLVAAAALNTVFQGVTGNAPLPDYIGAAADSVNDFSNKNSDKKDTPIDDTLQFGQRLLGETSKFIPGAPTVASMLLNDRTKEQVFGKNGDLTRFGEPALTKPLTSGIGAVTGALSGDASKVRDAVLGLVPTGTQAKRTAQGLDAMGQGYVSDSSGKVQSVVDQSNPLQWAQALVFGKNALPQQQQANQAGTSLSGKESDRFKNLLSQDKTAAENFFNKKIQQKVDNSNRKGTLTDTGNPAVKAATDGGNMTAQSILDSNKDRAQELKDSMSEEDYAISQLSKADRQKLLKSGGVTKEKLAQVDNFVKQKKKDLGYTTTPANLPENLNSSAAQVQTDYAALSADEKDAWNKATNNDPEIAKSLSAWTGGKAQLPAVSNEVAKDWADYQQKVAEGKISKLKVDDAKRQILRKAFNSQLDVNEQAINGLSKAELNFYHDNGTISDSNIQNALAVEKQMFDAGVITKESLANKLGLEARGYKKSGGRGGRRKGGKKLSYTSFKLPTDQITKYAAKGASIARNASIGKR